MLRLHRIKPLNWHSIALIGAMAAALMTLAPPAHAEGLFDFFFGGGFQRRPAPPSNVSSYAEPSPSIGRVAPPAMGSESVRQDSGDAGRAVAYCVRLCDGQHFPLEHAANATPVETCRAMCPAAKTKVFFGGSIDGAVARDGQRYTGLDTAYVYRKQLVANCTCNGKDAFGLAPYDMTNDPTLRPGDIVATKDGFVEFSGKRGERDAFTPVATATVTAQLIPASARTHLARRAAPAVADEDPGTISPSQSPRPVVQTEGQSVR